MFKVNGAAHASKEVEQSIKIDSFANSTQNVLPRTRQGREHDDYGDYTIIVVNARNNMNQRQQYYEYVPKIILAFCFKYSAINCTISVTTAAEKAALVNI